MKEAPQINSRLFLHNWLVDQPREVAVAIAQRSTSRVFPILGYELDVGWARKGELTALPVLRCLLASGAAGKLPTIEVRHFATRASNAAIEVAAVTPAAAAAVDLCAVTAKTAAITDNAAVAAANVVAAIATAANAANADSDDIWDQVRKDVRLIEAGNDLFIARLWSGQRPKWFQMLDAETRAIWAADPPGTWDFWLRWWDGVLSGNQVNWELQRDIVLELTEEDWTAGPARVAERIAEIEVRYAAPTVPILQTELMRAAFADFTLDSMRRLMVMVPFEEDIRNLRDPERLSRFLDDSADLRDALEDFCDAATAADRQSAKEVRVYADKVLTELSTTRQTEHLRVARLIDLGAVLHDFSLNENTRLGLGEVLPLQLDRIVDLLQNLLRSYFAPGMLRLKPLAEIRLLPQDDPARILGHLRRNLEAARKVKGNEVVPLAEEDLAVLSAVIEELERLRFAYDAAQGEDVKTDIGNQIARKSTQATVTFGRYWLMAQEKAGKAVDKVDWILKWPKRVEGVEGLLKFFKEIWDKI